MMFGSLGPVIVEARAQKYALYRMKMEGKVSGNSLDNEKPSFPTFTMSPWLVATQLKKPWVSIKLNLSQLRKLNLLKLLKISVLNQSRSDEADEGSNLEDSAFDIE